MLCEKRISMDIDYIEKGYLLVHLKFLLRFFKKWYS